MFNHIRMVVLATNAVGSPDLFLTSVEATSTQYEHGRHYDAAARMLRRAAAFIEGHADEV